MLSSSSHDLEIINLRAYQNNKGVSVIVLGSRVKIGGLGVKVGGSAVAVLTRTHLILLSKNKTKKTFCHQCINLF